MSSYGKLDEYEQARFEANRKAKKRFTIIAISSFILICIVIGAVVGTTVSHHNKIKSSEEEDNKISTSIKAICDVTLHKDKCKETIGTAPNANRLTPQELFNYAVNITVTELSKVLNVFSSHKDNVAMETCMELINLAHDELNETVTTSKTSSSNDLRTWLSSVVTYQETCMEALMETNDPSLKSFGETQLKNSTEMSSNALAIITFLGKIADSMKLKRRRLLSTVDLKMMDEGRAGPGARQVRPGFQDEGRKLLENGGDLRKVANIVVAKDGSGKFKTISEALESVEKKNEKRTIIYVKKGVYKENVKVEKKMWNVVMVGDGQSKTIVSDGLNVVDGTPTFKTATFAVFGKGFMARDMGFKNTAGPSKHQAVALMVSADFSVFYKCTMDAFQDTVYAHSQRQFYRNCDILGTVDFIFGNAAVVFQNCNLLPRRPMKGQKNIVTAQGKTDPNQNTGISIHNCRISPLNDLADTKTYLGRPWKAFSTTVVMKSFIGSIIDPKGWLPWTGDNAPDTIFYGEHLNFGPGASTKNRVKWRGLRTFLSKSEANRFTVKPFLDGNNWLPPTKVPFKSDL